jgi:hypothetical protein
VGDYLQTGLFEVPRLNLDLALTTEPLDPFPLEVRYFRGNSLNGQGQVCQTSTAGASYTHCVLEAFPTDPNPNLY